jgi:hypothetical protein
MKKFYLKLRKPRSAEILGFWQGSFDFNSLPSQISSTEIQKNSKAQPKHHKQANEVIKQSILENRVIWKKY